MSETGFTFDTKKFEEQLKKLRGAKLTKAIKEALFEAGAALALDIVEKAPSIPFDLGTLEGSIAIHVDDVREATSDDIGDIAGSATGTPLGNRPSDIFSLGSKTHSVFVSVNTPYAWRLHDHPEYNFRQTNRGTEGGKYIEAKLEAYGEDYMKVLQLAVAENLGIAT